MPIAEPASGLIFALEVDGAQMALFRTCSDLGSTSEVLEQKTTAADGTIVIRKVPGKLTWSNLVLERGVERSAKLWNWRQLVVDGKVAEARKDGAVVAMSQEGASLMRWDFVNGWPCGWRVSSTEDASGLAVERLEIAHDGLRLRVL